MKSTALIATLLIVLTGGSLAVAGSHGMLGFGGAGHHGHEFIGELIRELNLNQDQQQQVEKIHRAMIERFHGQSSTHKTHMETLLARVESGYMDPTEVRRTIDEHLAQMRHDMYKVSDEMVALFNTLDADQRTVLEHHLRQALEAGEHGSTKGHGHGGHGEDHGGKLSH